jgi:hypothetical protein
LYRYFPVLVIWEMAAPGEGERARRVVKRAVLNNMLML